MENEIIRAEIEDQGVQLRPIEVITQEINAYKGMAVVSFLEIGRRLIEAKEQLQHGEWLPWLETKVEFSEATAQRLMRLAREYSNPSLVTDLGMSKALELLALPAFEREGFMAQKHEVEGQEMSVLEMTKDQLKQAIAEKKEALEAVNVLNADMARMKKDNEAELAEVFDDFNHQLADKEEEISALQAEIEALRKAPKEVTATEVVRDEAAEAALKEKIEKLTAQLNKAKDEKKIIKDQLEAERLAGKEKESELDALAEKHKAELEALRKEKDAAIESMKKQVALSGSADAARFKVLFETVQREINSMSDTLYAIEKDNAELAGKLRAAGQHLLREGAETL